MVPSSLGLYSPGTLIVLISSLTVKLILPKWHMGVLCITMMQVITLSTEWVRLFEAILVR